MKINAVHDGIIYESALWFFEKIYHNQSISIEEIEEELKEIYEMGYDQGVEDTEDENG